MHSSFGRVSVWRRFTSWWYSTSFPIYWHLMLLWDLLRLWDCALTRVYFPRCFYCPTFFSFYFSEPFFFFLLSHFSLCVNSTGRHFIFIGHLMLALNCRLCGADFGISPAACFANSKKITLEGLFVHFRPPVGYSCVTGAALPGASVNNLTILCLQTDWQWD